MSRAFVNEDAGGWGNPARQFDLPDRDDPGFDRAAAEAMMEAAREGDTGSAEMATGYYCGEKKDSNRTYRRYSLELSQTVTRD